MIVKSETLAKSGNGGSSASDEPRENLLGQSAPELEKLLYALGEKPYRGRQVAEWIYGRGVADFAAMTNLPAPLRAKLEEAFTIGSLEERARRETPDRRTRKVAYALPAAVSAPRAGWDGAGTSPPPRSWNRRFD